MIVYKLDPQAGDLINVGNTENSNSLILKPL